MYMKYRFEEKPHFNNVKAMYDEMRKSDIDAEYGPLGFAISPINEEEVEKMFEICKKYGVEPYLEKTVD